MAVARGSRGERPAGRSIGLGDPLMRMAHDRGRSYGRSIGDAGGACRPHGPCRIAGRSRKARIDRGLFLKVHFIAVLADPFGRARPRQLTIAVRNRNGSHKRIATVGRADRPYSKRRAHDRAILVSRPDRKH